MDQNLDNASLWKCGKLIHLWGKGIKGPAIHHIKASEVSYKVPIYQVQSKASTATMIKPDSSVTGNGYHLPSDSFFTRFR
jgi:HSP20 family molecular chaperone IbpA